MKRRGHFIFETRRRVISAPRTAALAFIMKGYGRKIWWFHAPSPTDGRSLCRCVSSCGGTGRSGQKSGKARELKKCRLCLAKDEWIQAERRSLNASQNYILFSHRRRPQFITGCEERDWIWAEVTFCFAALSGSMSFVTSKCLVEQILRSGPNSLPCPVQWWFLTFFGLKKIQAFVPS